MRGCVQVPACFYSLISADTRDLAHNKGRQRFLVDQGYLYDVLNVVDGIAEEGQVRPFGFQRPREQEDLLTEILYDKHKDLDESDDFEAETGSKKNPTTGGGAAVGGSMQRSRATAASLTGGSGMVYQQRKASKQTGK